MIYYNINGFHIKENFIYETHYSGTELVNSFYNMQTLHPYNYNISKRSYAPEKASYILANIFGEKHHEYEIHDPFLPIILSYNISESYALSLKDVYQNYKKNTSPLENKEIYPIAVRYIDENNTYYIERPPTYTEVSFALKPGKNISTKIWIPWTMFVVNEKDHYNTFLFFSSQQLQSMQSKYTPALTPNIYSQGKVCYGASFHKMDLEVDNIRTLYATLYNEYMSGGWNSDIGPNIEPLMYHNTTTILQSSKKNINDIPSIIKFIETDAEEVRKYNPHLSLAKIENILDINHNSFEIMKRKMFLAFFLKMSTFSLQETLDFYQELFNISLPALNTPKFEEILITAKTQISHKDYSTAFSSICKSLENFTPASKTAVNKNIYIVIDNYSNTDLAEGFYSSTDYSSAGKILSVLFDKPNYINFLKTMTYSNNVNTFYYNYKDDTFVYDNKINSSIDILKIYRELLSNSNCSLINNEASVYVN